MTALTTKPTSMEAPAEFSSTLDTSKYKMIAENVTVSYGGIDAVKNVTMKFKEKSVTALIGPSGCGKTTFLRCLNRMHDMTKNAKVTGKVMIDDIDLYSKEIDPIYHRRKVGMVFQKPNPFPTMSVYDNVNTLLDTLTLFKAPLPVELRAFTCSLSNNSIKLNWKTATELNNSRFEIERKINGSEWQKIGSVDGAGNSTSLREYSFIDK